MASAAANTMYDSWLTVEYASRAFKLSLLRAIKEETRSVNDATQISHVDPPVELKKSIPKMYTTTFKTVNKSVL